MRIGCRRAVPRTGPPLLEILRAFHRDRRDLRLAAFDESQIRWAATTGLGSLLVWAVAEDPDAWTSPHWPLLDAADVSARVLAAEQLDAATDIIDACGNHLRPLTLLKGISLCEAHYPAAHLRPMRDIDVLAAKDELAEIRGVLLGLGYREQAGQHAADFEDLHHGVPLVHQRTGIWVELHRRLFPSVRGLRGRDPFRPEHVEASTVASTFRGRRVNRLRPELEVPYIASHWAKSSKAIHGAGGMVAMVDLICLLKRARDLRWDELLRGLDGSPATAHLYLMLSYLKRRGLVDVAPEVIQELADRQRSLGRLQGAALHKIMDRYVVGGREYGRLVTRRRNVRIVWESFVLPGPPWWNLAILPLHLLWDVSWRVSALLPVLRGRAADTLIAMRRLGYRTLARHMPHRLRRTLGSHGIANGS